MSWIELTKTDGIKILINADWLAWLADDEKGKCTFSLKSGEEVHTTKESYAEIRALLIPPSHDTGGAIDFDTKDDIRPGDWVKICHDAVTKYLVARVEEKVISLVDQRGIFETQWDLCTRVPAPPRSQR